MRGSKVQLIGETNLTPHIGESCMLSADLALMIVYRLLALFVAGMMAGVVWRERDWRQQLFAALVFVPFLLRATGIK
jgi:hypothetical protein